MRIGSRAILATIGVLTAAVRPAAGQASAWPDVAFNSQYIWRGVTSTNRLAIQPSLNISAPLRGLTVLAGAWGNIEPGQYDGAGDLSSLGGLPGPLVTQSEAWLEVGGTLANRLGTAVGVQGYFYPHVGDLAEYNTVELYASASRASTWRTTLPGFVERTSRPGCLVRSPASAEAPSHWDSRPGTARVRRKTRASATSPTSSATA